jgi:hypothetical protein
MTRRNQERVLAWSESLIDILQNESIGWHSGGRVLVDVEG